MLNIRGYYTNLDSRYLLLFWARSIIYSIESNVAELDEISRGYTMLFCFISNLECISGPFGLLEKTNFR
ncbi:hypothetical protein VNO77_17811 [Canavalia gladiata]|uniref:Uncharacterized protein n=1 Tax=Canavalia gladiata TaxID=3824 RepID=A0AAN9LJU3_CANGL